MTHGRLIVSVFIQRLGIQEPTVHPLMRREFRSPLRAWNTGHIWYSIRDITKTEDFAIPNWVNNQERLRFLYSPRWMDSAFEYQGATGEILCRAHFSCPLDGEQRVDRTDFFDGHVIVKYAAKGDE